MAPRKIQHFIHGHFEPSESQEVLRSPNPSTGETLAEVSVGGEREVDRAVSAARRAFDEGDWPRLPASERAEYLRSIADALEENTQTLAKLESMDTGLPVAFTEGQVVRAVHHFRYFAGEAERLSGETYPMDGAYVHVTSREPMGVAAILTPWNSSLGLSTMSGAAALACGNTVVLKPSEWSPVTVTELAKIVQALELPPGVFNVVHGPGHPTGEALVRHRGVDVINFTGGTATGRRILGLAAEGLKRCVCELGGKAPTLIFADADVEQALDGTLLCAFANNGEACIAGSRLLVERSLYDAFVEKFVARVRQLRVGDPLLPETEVGPVISQPHLERLGSLIQSARQEGANLRCGGGTVPKAFSRGYYLEPTVLSEVPPQARISREEVLGPVVTFTAFESEEEALAMANATEYGLAAYVWSGNAQRLMRTASRLRTGTVWANSSMIRDIRAPFGGFKQSGIGRVGGRYSIESFTEVKDTCIPVQPLELPRLGVKPH
jgi:5-carboxymethyl-2-hydroxymuconic-semialdehyde dehydrogenase